jgi:murein DD-endopeptidase MepM/ murein hydrolase activator NlpD
MLSPYKIRSRFLGYLLENNQPYMAGFKQWIFQPGMEFNSSIQWWGDNKPRSSPHEGIDLCRFENSAGEVKEVNGSIRIPAAWAGKIRKIDHDFLGKSIFISHEIFDENAGQLYTIYGHTDPGAAIKAPGTVRAGEIIGVIADPPERRTTILPHLHITVAWIPAWFPLEQLVWQNIGSDSSITLLNPLLIL